MTWAWFLLFVAWFIWIIFFWLIHVLRPFRWLTGWVVLFWPIIALLLNLTKRMIMVVWLVTLYCKRCFGSLQRLLLILKHTVLVLRTIGRFMLKGGHLSGDRLLAVSFRLFQNWPLAWNILQISCHGIQIFIYNVLFSRHLIAQSGGNLLSRREWLLLCGTKFLLGVEGGLDVTITSLLFLVITIEIWLVITRLLSLKLNINRWRQCIRLVWFQILSVGRVDV